jgi:hypothetical protein
VGFLQTSPCEIGGECQDYGKTENLQTQTGQHQMDTHVLESSVISNYSYGASTSLQEQRDEVRYDEDNCNLPRCEPRELRAIDSDYSAEADVDRRTYPSGPKCEGDEVPDLGLACVETKGGRRSVHT